MRKEYLKCPYDGARLKRVATEARQHNWLDLGHTVEWLLQMKSDQHLR